MGFVEFPVKDSMYNSYRIEEDQELDTKDGRVSPDIVWRAERVLPGSLTKNDINRDIWESFQKQSNKYNLTKKQRKQTSRVGLERIALKTKNLTELRRDLIRERKGM